MEKVRRSLGLAPPTPMVLLTVVVLVVAYMASALAVKFHPASATFVTENLVLIPSQVIERGHVWSLVTYALIHDFGDPMHLVFNCLGIYFLGPALELRWGRGRFLLFMLITVVTGGVFVVLTHLIGLGSTPAIGASAFALGLSIAYGLTFPERDVMFLVFPMKAIAFVYIGIALCVLDAVSQSGSSVAAHVGGMVAAALLVEGIWRRGRMILLWDALLVKLRVRKPPRLTVVPRGPDKYVQ